MRLTHSISLPPSTLRTLSKTLSQGYGHLGNALDENARGYFQTARRAPLPTKSITYKRRFSSSIRGYILCTRRVDTLHHVDGPVDRWRSVSRLKLHSLLFVLSVCTHVLTSPTTTVIPIRVTTDEVNAIVLDIGTYSIKSGYAGEDAPKFSCPTQLGVAGAAPATTNSRKKKDVDAMDIDDRVFKTGQANLETPTEHMEVISPFNEEGVLDDWDAVAALCEYMLKGQMRLNTEEHPVMLAEPSHNTNSVREKMVELMFETYNVPAVFLAKNAVLSSFAMGRQTSLVVDMGHESTVGTSCTWLLIDSSLSADWVLPNTCLTSYYYMR